jgi:hypothetical protein
MKVGFFLFVFIFTCYFAHPQTRQAQSRSSAQGSLTVTATVESSVWLAPTPEGKQEVVVANAPDPKQTFYRKPTTKWKEKRLPVRLGTNTKATAIKKAAFAVTPGGQQGNRDEAPVVFGFPAIRMKFDVTQKTQIMDLTDAGATRRATVEVITVVAL